MSEVAAMKSGYQKIIDLADELVTLREQCTHRVVVDAEVYNEMQRQSELLRPLAGMHLLTGEKRACAVFDWQYVNNILPADISNPEVGSKMKREHKFSAGKYVDRAIRHDDGRLTLVELKDSADERAIVAGIGQVLWYAAMAEADSTSAPIVPVLAVLGERDKHVARACERAGVRYYPMGSIAHFKFMSIACDIAINHGCAKES